MPTLTLAELGRFLGEHYSADVLRVETLQNYRNESEQDGLHRYLEGEPPAPDAGDTPWIRQLRAHVAAGRSWRVLHAVTQPLTDYVRYEMECGYVHNAAAGQQIRITEHDQRHEQIGDLLIIDRRHVFRYQYDDEGRFVSAEHVTDRGDAAALVTLADALWDEGADFTAWWDAHPTYHRNTLAA